MAEETVRSFHDMMEKLIKQASELNLGPSSNQIPLPTRPMDPGKRKSGSIASGQCSDTSGAIRSDDDFSSIGYSYEDHEHDGIVDPPQAAGQTTYSRGDQEPDPVVFDAGSPGGQFLDSLKAEALKDRAELSRKKTRTFHPT